MLRMEWQSLLCLSRQALTLQNETPQVSIGGLIGCPLLFFFVKKKRCNTEIGKGLPINGDSFWSVKACLDRQSELCHSVRNISHLTSNFLLLKTLYRATINSLIFPNEITTYDEEIEAKLP